MLRNFLGGTPLGYQTYFDGRLSITPALTPEQVRYINAFGDVRHMKRDVTKLAPLADSMRIAVGLPLGDEGAYYIGGRDKCPSIIDYNEQPASQPGLWCKWEVTPDGCFLQWDEREKFYDYVEWLEYLIEHFFGPWGRVLNGEITWDGEESCDWGIIAVKNNVVEAMGLTEAARIVLGALSGSPSRPLAVLKRFFGFD